MSEAHVWDETTRGALREILQRSVVGEVRLAQSAHDDIIQTCREVYIEEECPEEEWEVFVRFATDELTKAEAVHAASQSTWPAVTDSDRLDRVEAILRDRGILLWQASPCCDTCTGGELPDRIDEIDRRFPGFRDKVRGYAFFIDQNMADSLAEDIHLAVYMGYGWWSREESDVAPDVYERKALDIAQEVCECLREQGFDPKWDGSFAKKIGMSLDWQRRTLLE